MPASEAEQVDRRERGAGQYVGMRREVAVALLRGDAPHKDTGI